MKPVFDHRCERSVCGARYLYEFQERAKIPPRFDRWLFFSPKAVRQLQIFPNSVDHHIVYFHFSAKIHKAAACLGYRSLFYKHKVFAGREQRVLIARVAKCRVRVFIICCIAGGKKAHRSSTALMSGVSKKFLGRLIIAQAPSTSRQQRSQKIFGTTFSYLSQAVCSFLFRLCAVSKKELKEVLKLSQVTRKTFIGDRKNFLL